MGHSYVPSLAGTLAEKRSMTMTLWRSRIVAKLILSRLPISYRRWASLGLFRHGHTDDPSYAWQVLDRHASLLPATRQPWRGLELGPGDGLLTALIAPAFGSSGVTLVDAGDFAHRDANRYRASLAALRESHPAVSIPCPSEDLDTAAILTSVGGEYLTNGLSSLRSLRSASYDFIWSHAVMEHVRAGEYADTAKELRRLIAPGGVMSHVIDYKDHLGGALNNLRFRSSRWENDGFAARSGFYTNRIRHGQTIGIFSAAGFAVETVSVKRWTSAPIRRQHLAPEFTCLSDDELLISGAHLVMRPA
jgi:SAM-dependent methyltransferase